MPNIIITKVLNRLKVMVELRSQLNLSLDEAKRAVNNLPYVFYINKSFNYAYDIEYISNRLCGIAEFCLELTDKEKEIESSIKIQNETNAKMRAEREKAMKWYEELSDTEKHMVDILTSYAIPCA